MTAPRWVGWPRPCSHPSASVDLAYVDPGTTGPKAANAAKARGIALEAIKLPDDKRGFVPLPRRWIVERVLRLGHPLSPAGEGR